MNNDTENNALACRLRDILTTLQRQSAALSLESIDLEPRAVWLRTVDRLAHDIASLEIEAAELRREVARLRTCASLAYRDPLTGLRNRRYFEQRVAEETNRARRDPRQPFTILVCDVDDFKAINDTCGHAGGDEALCWIARLIESNLREHDVCCRYAGDEFVVVLPQTDGKSAALLVNRLRRRMTKTSSISACVSVSVSIGLATFGEDSRDAAELFRLADRRMYQDKRRRKGVRATAELAAAPAGTARSLAISRC
jgi:diguanylate cyclase (GGDEF)-like protein